jgi:hypothetical protein
MKKAKSFKIIPGEEYSDNFFNIKPSSEFVPEWYRKSPSKIEGTNTELSILDPRSTNSTYKKCTPFLDAMISGYTVYLTADLEIGKSEEGKLLVFWRTKRNIVTEHSENQWEGLPVPTGYHSIVLKWHNQFSLNVPDGYSLKFCHPVNRFDLPFQTITGIVDCDKYPGQVHFPFFLKEEFTGIIPEGTPIAQIIPIKRDSWKRQHLEYNKDFSEIYFEKFFSTIKRSYKKNYWFKKEYR